MVQSKRSSGCFVRRGVDHSIKEASKVDVEFVGIFNKRREFHEDE